MNNAPMNPNLLTLPLRFDTLPVELRLWIFSLAFKGVADRKSILQVCRAWRQLGFDWTLWKNSDSLVFGSEVPVEFMCDAVTTFAPVLTSITVELGDGTGSLLRTLVRNQVPHLRRLTISGGGPGGSVMTVDQVEAAASIVKKLESFTLFVCA